MSVIRQQLAKIYHFLIILVLLFGVNAAFNLKYDWGGVSVIVRTYIMVLIFYCIFLFSQLNYDDLIVDYTKKYGRRARHKLFFDIRLFPFAFAMLLTFIFTMINYMGRDGWPFDPIIRLLDGKYSNTLFYGLILFFILRQNRRPGIAIPAFMVVSSVFFMLDKFLYAVFTPGTGVGLVKLGKYIFFNFALIYDYSRSSVRFVKAIVFSVISGLIMFSATAAMLFIMYMGAVRAGQPGSLPLRMLLKTGFISQIDRLEEVTRQYKKRSDIKELVFYSRKYGRDISFDSRTWESLLVRYDIDAAEKVFVYLREKNIMLDFGVLSDFAVSRSLSESAEFASAENFKRYFSEYFRDHGKEYMQMFRNGNEVMKTWIMDCLAYAENPEAITFLINFLTNLDRNISLHAYNALKNITDIDPAKTLGREVYDIDVVNAFLQFRDERVNGGH